MALSNKRAFESLNRGAESIRFTIENENVSISDLMQNIPLENTSYFFYLPFLSIDFITKINEFAATNNAKCTIQIDPIGQLTKDGNWFDNLDKDFEKLNIISAKATIPFITINNGIYQNAGANMVQQLAYTLAHINEYFNRIKSINQPITIEVAVGTNYFFEIAKLRALRLLFNTLAKEYNHNFDCHIIVTPTKFINNLITANNLSDTAYSSLIKNINEPIEDIQLELLGETKIEILIRENIFEFNKDNIDKLREFSIHKQILSTELNFDLYLEQRDDEDIEDDDKVVFTIEEIKLLLISETLTDDDKIELIPEISENQITKENNLGNIISGILINNKPIELTFEFLSKIVSLTDNIDVKIKLCNLYSNLFLLSRANIESVLNDIGSPFSNIVLGGLKPPITASQWNANFIESLKRSNYINSYSIHDYKITKIRKS